MRLSGRVGRIGESATLAVARRAKELAAAGVDVVDLSAGEPDFASPASAVEAAKRALDEGRTRYTASSGIPELREALAQRYRRVYGAPWRAAQVVVSVGAKAALLELALALVEEGDEVIVPSPYWVSIPEQVRLAGGEAVLVATSVDDGFRLRAAPILAAMTPRTRGVILNSPCNPTGGMITEEDLRAIVQGCAARGAWVVSDETYEHFVYDGGHHVSAAPLAAEFPETVIVVGSFSKTYAMTGWRIGFALGPEAVLGAVGVIQSHATSNPTTFAMLGALEAMSSAGPRVEEMIAEFEARRDLVARALDALPGVRCQPPGGAFYAFPHVARCYRQGRSGSVALAADLLERARVAVVPGLAFGADEHIRLSFACSRDTLEEGLGRMAEVLAD